ncbi:hypothetical protein M407DRAFT_244584 [Tulasnella calospora MUT 4182]|uniref:Uncharacterized protein n=1 Tax=Tulasnella calospora MUT 4182 TaxID=1051891 RepID=A0A0C3LRH7_9AGAM|nr:hypothetical protein M407DRAFT_244584 [Tulasnella calospora MUT 4182]
MKSSFTSDFPSIRVIAWDISEGGDVRLAWFQGNQKTLLDMFISEEELEITIGADSNTYGTNYPEESRARLILQPVI